MHTVALPSRNILVAGHAETGDFTIDNTVKVYKVINGVETLVRTENPYPENWGCFNSEPVTPEKQGKKSKRARCPKREPPPKDELTQAYKELGPAISNVAKRYGAGFTTIRRWLREYEIIDIYNNPIRKVGIK